MMASALARMAYNNFSGIGKAWHRYAQGGRQGGARRRGWRRRSPSSCSGTRASTSVRTRITGINDADYKPPFPLTAKFNKLTIKIDRPQLSPEDIKKLETAMQEKAKRD
jgi:hypothetical protein